MKKKRKSAFILEKKEYRFRYLLHGSAGAWLDYFIEDDDRDKLRLEAYYRLKEGYSAYLVDQKTNTEVELRLKKNGKETEGKERRIN